MAHLFLMPQPGSTMEEGTILKWHKPEGTAFRKGEVLLEIETDKASVEVEAEEDAVLRKILAPENMTVAVRKPIAILGTADESIDALLAEAGVGGAANGAQRPASEAAPETAPAPSAATSAAHAPAAPQAPAGKVFISPRARRVADEHSVPIAALAGRGTGPEGRVVEKDVLAFLEQGYASTAPASASESAKTPTRVTPLAARIAEDLGVNVNDLSTGLPGSRVRSEDVLRHARTGAETVAPAPAPAKEAAVSGASQPGVTVQPFVGMRKRIADNVAKSAFTAPHVTLTLEVDMTTAATFRSTLIPDVEKAYGTRLSFTDILVKAVARALGEHPLLNAALIGDEVRIYTAKNVGVAVALDQGLIVPVVKNADAKSLGAVSVELKQLVERARTGKFTPDDLAEGTFTITNLGTFGIDVFDPIIVPPQAAILGVGRIADKAVVVDKQVVVRTMMNLCLSFDHRILDGVPAARFLQRVKELLEAPLLILV